MKSNLSCLEKIEFYSKMLEMSKKEEFSLLAKFSVMFSGFCCMRNEVNRDKAISRPLALRYITRHDLPELFFEIPEILAAYKTNTFADSDEFGGNSVKRKYRTKNLHRQGIRTMTLQFLLLSMGYLGEI